MSWRLSKALMTLRDEVNEEHPNRSKISDGTKGDDAHAHRVSDHNPDAAGIVHAWDCTVWDDTDPDFDDDVARPLAEFLRAKRDPRTKYVIHRGQMFSSYDSYKAGKLWRKAWTWGIYTGPNGHFHHVHVSVYGDDGAPWGYPRTSKPAWTPPKFPGTVKPGDESERVRAWAFLLRTLGYQGFTLEGPSGAVYGVGKVRATRAFQRRYGLTVDGIVGPKTWAAACAEIARRKAKQQ